MTYSIDLSGIVQFNIDLECYDIPEEHEDSENIDDAMQLNLITKEFELFNNALLETNIPIHTFNFSLSNSGCVNDAYLEASTNFLDDLSTTLENIENLLNVRTLEISFYTSELIYDQELVDSMCNFIYNFPNADKITDLKLNLHGVAVDDDSHIAPDAITLFADDFFSQYTSLKAFAISANYLNDSSTSLLMAFIIHHAKLTSLTVDLSGGSRTFDLRQVLLNKNLNVLQVEHNSLYPGTPPKPFIPFYWMQLGQHIKSHPNLNTLKIKLSNEHKPAEPENINLLIREFLRHIAYNRSLNNLCIIIQEYNNNLHNDADTALIQQHFMENSSIENLEINLKGIVLLTVVERKKQPYAALRQQTLANRENLQNLAAAPNPDLTTTLHLAKYVPHFVSQAYQPINEDNMASVRFKLGYISAMLNTIKLYDLPIDLIADQVLSFLQPKDVCKLSVATGGFFHQKRFEMDAAQPSDTRPHTQPLN